MNKMNEFFPCRTILSSFEMLIYYTDPCESKKSFKFDYIWEIYKNSAYLH